MFEFFFFSHLDSGPPCLSRSQQNIFLEELVDSFIFFILNRSDRNWGTSACNESFKKQNGKQRN